MILLDTDHFLVDGLGLSIATDDDGYSPCFGVATNKSG